MSIAATLTTSSSDRSLLLSLPAAGGAGSFCAAHPQAERGCADRLVHAAIFYSVRHRDLGDLDCHADRLSAAASQKRRQARARVSSPVFPGWRLSGGTGSPRSAWTWLVKWRTGAQSIGDLEITGFTGGRRHPQLAAADDVVATAAGLRPKLCPHVQADRQVWSIKTRASRSFGVAAVLRLPPSSTTASSSCSRLALSASCPYLIVDSAVSGPGSVKRLICPTGHFRRPFAGQLTKTTTYLIYKRVNVQAPAKNSQVCPVRPRQQTRLRERAQNTSRGMPAPCWWVSLRS